MKSSIIITSAIVLTLLLLLPTLISSRHIGSRHSRHGHHHTTTTLTGDSKAEEGLKKWERSKPMKPLGVAGSTLPDCSHACGSCTPCRLVMVSFVCASIEEAESCPVAYRCMCKNKSYPVP